MNKLKILLTASIGNILELYDFALFAFLLPKLSDYFFPAKDPVTSLIYAFGVFAIGFLTRPVGGILFGHIGDKYGRKTAFSYSLIIMAAATASISLLPSYEMAGIYSPLALTALRLVQGLCLGGEYSGSLVTVLEHMGYHKEARPGLVGAVVTAAGISGWFLGAFVSMLCLTFGWNWRLAFAFGAVTGLLGLYLRRHMEESPALKSVKKRERFPLKSLMQEAPAALFATASMGALIGALFYGLFVFPNTYLPKFTGLSSQIASTSTTIGIGSYVIFLPLMGWISDRIGHSKMMIIAAAGALAAALPLYSFFASGTLIQILSAEILGGVVISAFMAPVSVVMTEIFPAHIRYTGSSLGYNLGVSLLGGTTPMISMILIHWTGSSVAPALYLMGCAVLGIVAGWLSKKRLFAAHI